MAGGGCARGRGDLLKERVFCFFGWLIWFEKEQYYEEAAGEEEAYGQEEQY
jgi:hypothetical protein